jgi:beta-galactosidase
MFSTPNPKEELLGGGFLLGVNYWPCEYGVSMWKKWAPSVIDRDFGRIAALGCTLVRIFLVWEDFQPIREYTGYRAGNGVATYLGDRPLKKGEPPVDAFQVAKFDEMLLIAEKHGLRLIPTFFTGWMSGTLFDVPWRDGRNIFSDPYMLRRQAELVSYFAGRYKDHPTIWSWDLGNEQNCFMPCNSRHDAWLWTDLLTKEIRLRDKNHLVTSGMHMDVDKCAGNFTIEDLSGLLDYVCIHTYPKFRAICSNKLSSLKTTYLNTFEYNLHSNLSGKDVLCQEFAGLSCSRVSDEVEKEYIAIVLHSLLANGCMGALYWCYSDFATTDELPYAANPFEKHLGLVDCEGRPGAVAEEIKEFSKIAQSFSAGGWHADTPQAAVIVPRHITDNTAIFNCYILAKMAGLDVRFTYPDSSLEEFKLVFMPSVEESSFTLPDWENIKRFVHTGGTLYYSYKGSAMRDMEELFGIRLEGDDRDGRLHKFAFNNSLGEIDLSGGDSNSIVMLMSNRTAEVISTDIKGQPNILLNSYGNGKAILCTEPLETFISERHGSMPGKGIHNFYEWMASQAGIIVNGCGNHFIEYKQLSGRGGTLNYLINHSFEEQTCVLPLQKMAYQTLGGRNIIKVEAGEGGLNITLGPAGAVLLITA